MTVRISGFFRDAFPHLVVLLDDAIAKVAALDEPADRNYVAAHAREDAERLAGELGEQAWRQRDDARVRLASRAPTAPGSCSSSTRATGAATPTSPQVYEAWGGFAYGRGLEGARAGDAMRDCFGRIEVAVKNVDSREHDILDSDDYYQYHGGMVATVRAHRRPRARRLPRRQLRSLARRRAHAWPRRRAACSARASPTRAGSRR